jgi:O-antigen/teichoic acid export membrane protein
MGTNWSIRMKQFRSISYAKISNAFVGNLSKIAFGMSNFGYIGLIIGTTIGLIVSNIWFMLDLSKVNKKYRIKSRSPRNFLLAKEYSEFPKVNLPHTLMDLGRDLLIAVLLLQLFSKEDYGLYNHSYQMLRLPLIFAGLAIGQVFFQRCAEKINNNEDILPLMTKAVRTLTLLSIVPFSIIFFFGEELFTFVFGENWTGAGTFSEIMAPWFLVNFITSPISSLPLIIRRQKSFFKIAMIGSGLLILSVVLPNFMFSADIKTTLWIMSSVQVVYFMVLIYKIFGFVKELNAKD